MARIAVIASELMFASRISEIAAAAGHQVSLTTDFEPGSPAAAELLAAADLIVADLEAADPEALVGTGLPVLGIYSHVDIETRRRAESAGVDRAVPRSKAVRELPELITELGARPRSERSR